MKRKIDIVRIRREMLPKGSEKIISELKELFKGKKECEIEETKVSFIIWENVEE